jgi:hypothetical protein
MSSPTSSVDVYANVDKVNNTMSVVPSLYDLSLQKSFYNLGLYEITNLVLPKNIIADQVGKLVGHGTFIYRLLLTPTDNLDSLMKSENLWNSIYSVRNFNKRICHCCSCDYVGVDYRDVKCEQHICRSYYPEWEKEEPDLELCTCKCIYPRGLQLDIETTMLIMRYLKNAGIPLEFGGLEYDNSILDKEIITLYELTPDQVNELESQNSLSKIKCFTMNYNVLRIMSGMSGLKLTYSS